MFSPIYNKQKTSLKHIKNWLFWFPNSDIRGKTTWKNGWYTFHINILLNENITKKGDKTESLTLIEHKKDSIVVYFFYYILITDL